MERQRLEPSLTQAEATIGKRIACELADWMDVRCALP
jgi:hypothetical protein